MNRGVENSPKLIISGSTQCLNLEYYIMNVLNDTISTIQ